MHLAAILPAAAGLANILISNDDGWAELNIRILYDAVVGAGHKAIISAPAVNKSGRGSLDGDPIQLGDDGCEFASCPPFSPPTGSNASQQEFNYVNSYPVTSVKLGIKQTSLSSFGGPPDLVLSGVNVGCNLDIAVLGSGTVGAACEAVKEGIPAIALSGCTGSQVSWESVDSGYSALYAELGMVVASAVIKAGKPYLPPNIWLNINFPETSSKQCSKVGHFSFVMSRIVPAVPFITDKDIDICDNDGRLPAERSVINTAGCYASISVGFADTKHTADAAHQQLVYDRIKHVLTCLPESGNSIDL